MKRFGVTSRLAAIVGGSSLGNLWRSFADRVVGRGGEGGGTAGQVPDLGQLVLPGQVTRLAEDVAVQGVAAALRRLQGQEHPTFLTAITILVEVAPNTFDLIGVLPVPGDDRLLAHITDRGVFPVIILRTMNVVVFVHSEALVGDRPVAHHTPEALGVVAVPHGSHYVLHDQRLAGGAFLQRVLIAMLTDGPSIFLVVQLPGQEAVTLAAGEAAGVVLLLHGLDGGGGGEDGLVAERAGL